MDWSFFQFEVVLIAVATLLLLGVFASKASHKLGVPALLLFLGIGMLAGSEGIGGIEFDDVRTAQLLGIVALAYILFAGGLDTQWEGIRPILSEGIGLATVGVVLTAVGVGLAASWLLGLSLLEGLLLGSIVSSTDAPAVFGLLRSKRLHLRGRLKPLLELESGSNDPMAVLLTLGFITLLTAPDPGPLGLGVFFVLQAVVGAGVGLGVGRLLVMVLNRLHLEYDGLYPVLTLSGVLLIYAGATQLGGSGFLAVYLAGLIMGKSQFVHKRSLLRFHDGIAWLMQIAMFLTLGLLVFPSQLLPVALSGFILSLLLIFIARPLAVYVTLFFSKMPLNEKAFVSWVGLKGAVPIIIATFPLLDGVPQADAMFNIVFFVVLTSVLIQGTSIPLVARFLRVEEKPEEAKVVVGPDLAWEEELSVNAQTSSLHEIDVAEGSSAAGKQIVGIGFPSNALVVALHRDDRTMVPAGSTTLLPGDRLVILLEDEAVETTRSLLQGRDGAAPHAGAPYA
ncbi:MAG: potassium/proton antiporter [Dehalococcoidia bacterium]